MYFIDFLSIVSGATFFTSTWYADFACRFF